MRLCVKIFVLLLCSAGLVKSSQDTMRPVTIVPSVAQLAMLTQWIQATQTSEKYNLELPQDHGLSTPSPNKRKNNLSPASEDGLTSSESDNSDDDHECSVSLARRSGSFSRTEPSRKGSQSMPPSDSGVSIDVFTPGTPVRPYSAGNVDRPLFTQMHGTGGTPSPITPKK